MGNLRWQPAKDNRARIDPAQIAKSKAEGLQRSGRVDEAIEVLSDQLLKNPGRTEILLWIAKTLLESDRWVEAAETFIVLRSHLPNSAEVAKLYGVVLSRMRQLPAAIDQFLVSIKIQPGDPECWAELARCYEQLGQTRQAGEAVKAAARLKPDDSRFLCYAATVLHGGGAHHDAIELLTKNPELVDLPEVKLCEATMIPTINRSVEEIDSVRQSLQRALKELRRDGARMADPEEKIFFTNFLVGYHGLEDRELLQGYAETLLEIAPELGYVGNLERESLAGRKIRVGFVSSNMRNHSVGRVLNRFLKELDRCRFEVLLFELPGKFQGGQELARRFADETIILPATLASIRQQIEKRVPDILVFPDFVLDVKNDLLAFSRLAPVQVSTWGHPGTSGRPSLDYWISCRDWEPVGNERLYTEKLVRLENPPMIATRLEPPERVIDRQALGLPSGTLYGCPQSIYKIHPKFDEILAKILQGDPGGSIVLISGSQKHWSELFVKRFRSSFGNLAERLVILPHLDTQQYLSLLCHCAISLDPTEFGGANTSMEAFSMGLPVVTWPGTQLRNRQTFSFYRMMNFMELVVDSQESYVSLALRIGNNPQLRTRLSNEVQDRCKAIFDTVEVTRELEEFFIAAAKEAIRD